MNANHENENENENGTKLVVKPVVVIRKRRRRLLPPSTLAWPSSIDQQSQPLPSLTNSSNSATRSVSGIHNLSGSRNMTHDRSKKKNSVVQVPLFQGKTTRQKNANRQPSQQKQQQQWIDKHIPSSNIALCVAPKKVREVKDWIEARLNYQNQSFTTGRNNLNAHALQPSYSNPEKLLILVGPPGIGKSTLVNVLAHEMGLSVLEWNDSHGDYNGNCNGNGNGNGDGGIQYQSQIASFEEFLSSVAFPYEAVSRSGVKSLDNGRGSSVVLLDELPNLHTPEAEAQFRNVMTRYMEKTHTPTIFIFSNVSEGKHKPEDLEKIIDVHMLYSPFVKILQINPVTKAKMKACLKDIFKKEGLRLGTGKAVDEFFEELYLKNGGDLRHAIMNVQFRMGALIGGSGGQKQTLALAGVPGDSRDTKLSTFHALGKLLYAKRVKVEDITMHDTKPMKSDGDDEDYRGCAWNRELRPPLQFDPERVLDDGDIGISGALSFVQCHAPDFFSDITELGQAFDRFSDAAFLLDTPIETFQGSSYPNGYAISLCSRAVGDANKHPAPSRFRQLTAPKMFEAKRKQRENEGKIDRVCNRLSYREHYLTLDVNTRSSQQFATNELPYIKRIIPEEVATISGNLYANSSYVVIDGTDQNDPNNRLSIELEQQKAVLRRDDIVDSSDSEAENEEKSSNNILRENNRPLPVKKYKDLPSKRQPDVIIID